MGKAKKTRKVAAVKRLLSPKDARLKENKVKQAKKEAALKQKAVNRQCVIEKSVIPCELLTNLTVETSNCFLTLLVP